MNQSIKNLKYGKPVILSMILKLMEESYVVPVQLKHFR
jgi:hypothetical protein